MCVCVCVRVCVCVCVSWLTSISIYTDCICKDSVYVICEDSVYVICKESVYVISMERSTRRETPILVCNICDVYVRFSKHNV